MPSPLSSPLRRLAATLLASVALVSVGFVAAAADAEPVAPVRDIVFPAAGPVRYADTFGACRSGCTRTHEGEDLMGDKLVPLVAATDAVVTWLKGTATPDGSNGNYVMLRDADGWEYWYIHINNDSPGTDDGANPPEWRFGPGIERGAEVKAGQLIGYLGDSGNAEWTAPHLHFEIHQPDGTAINPNPSLDAAVRIDRPITPEPTDNQLFVRSLSLDFLGYEADNVTLAGYVNALDQGASRRSVIDDFANSDEWAGALITGFYESTLGRAPDAAGLRNWLGALDNGMTPAQIAARFYSSAEYFNRSGGTNTAWITDLYREILLRDPDASGLENWVRLVDNGEPRSRAAGHFYGSVESRQTRVTGLYQALLGRNPDELGMSTWTQVLRNGRDIELAATLASSAEYHARALRRSPA